MNNDLKFVVKCEEFGNEYSTRDNVFGIMHKCEFSLLGTLRVFLEGTIGGSERMNSVIPDYLINKFESSLKGVLIKLESELYIIKSKEYDLGRQIKIDNLRLKIRALESELAIYSNGLEFINYARECGNPVYRKKYEKITINKLIQCYAGSKYSNFSPEMASELRKNTKLCKEEYFNAKPYFTLS